MSTSSIECLNLSEGSETPPTNSNRWKSFYSRPFIQKHAPAFVVLLICTSVLLLLIQLSRSGGEEEPLKENRAPSPVALVGQQQQQQQQQQQNSKLMQSVTQLISVANKISQEQTKMSLRLEQMDQSAKEQMDKLAKEQNQRLKGMILKDETNRSAELERQLSLQENRLELALDRIMREVNGNSSGPSEEDEEEEKRFGEEDDEGGDGSFESMKTQGLFPNSNDTSSRLLRYLQRLSSSMMFSPAFRSIGNSHYYLSTEEKTWEMAKSACEKINSYLAEFHSEEQFILVNQTLWGEGEFWIGAESEDNEKHFEWKHSGETLSYTRWDEREPRPNQWERSCVYVSHSFWKATSCQSNVHRYNHNDYMFRFLCQY